MLPCVALSYATLHFFMLHDISVTLLYPQLHYIKLLYPMSAYAMLSSLHYNMLHSLPICSVTFPCLALCYIILCNLLLGRPFQTPPSQSFPFTGNAAPLTDAHSYCTSLHYNTLSYVALCCIAFNAITLLILSHLTSPTLHYFMQPYPMLHSVMLR